MFYAPNDRPLVDIYRCRGCQKAYHRQIGGMKISCCVAHGEGSCCHFGEREITDEQVDTITKLIGTYPQNQTNADGSITIYGGTSIAVDGVTITTTTGPDGTTQSSIQG